MKQQHVNEQKISGITGAKGVGAVVILLYHFCQQFFPSVITNDAATRVYNVEKVVSSTPLYILVNAQFFISVFWGISGFLMSYHWYCNHDVKRMREKEAKKYVSFLGPFLLTTIVSFLLLKTNRYYHDILGKSLGGVLLGSVYNFEPHIKDAIAEAVYGVFFLGVANYNPVLWTMKVEFIGSLLLLGWLVLWGDAKNRMIWWGIVCLLFMMYNPSYLPMMAGAITADFVANQGIKRFGKRETGIAIFVIIFLGGIPFVHTPTGIYKYLPNWNVWIYYTLSIPFVLILGNNAKFLSCRLLGYLGQNSFQIYLFHFIIQCSVTSQFCLQLYEKTGGPILLIKVAAFIFQFIITIVVAEIYNKTLGKWWNQGVKKIIFLLCN